MASEVFLSAFLALSKFTYNNTVNGPGCFAMFGCYPIEPPWVSERRPIALYPKSPEEIGVRFVFFNAQHRQYPKEQNRYSNYIDVPDLVDATNINPDKMIYFITHGFLEKGATKWIEKMMNRLLDREPESTVIVIDWGPGSDPPYNQACANIRLVGTITAHVIIEIAQQVGLKNLDNVHMIGHSLGSHLSGYTGYTLRKEYNVTLGRITGLDPAELAFADTDEMVRLDPSDAKFVDVVHSDATPFVSNIGLGLYAPIGHVDFYPNGGFNQPNCPVTFWKEQNRFVSSVFQYFSCSHSRSYMYFTESITTPLQVVSCGSYESYNAGECFDCSASNALCVEFGLNSLASYRELISQNKLIPRQNTPIQFFFKTNSYDPFLMPNVKITIKIADTRQSRQYGAEIGKIFLYISGLDEAEPKRIDFNEEPRLFEPGLNYSSVIAVHSNIKPASVKIGWKYETNLLNPLTWRLLSAPRVFIKQVQLQFLTHQTTLQMCPSTGTGISTNELGLFTENNCKQKPDRG
ncbi:pancreatic triacylglycerol lipase-like [Anopheles maculipalpis]|uniref:pancreatic triacylglycerol lipase-like n=1 Tax=Anopheles maculipalpis TaxID=1496333 RepID=UPI002159555D|nr:pancreatic triacylglycerol lipase-like [Anopheles maculipalpis]